MFKRDIEEVIKYSATYFSVITITGPGQFGKITLAKSIFSDKPYISLEDIDIRNCNPSPG